MSNFNFKDNLIIESGKFLKWNDITGIYDIIGVNTEGNLKINAPTNGDIYINDTFSNTFINSKLAVGIFDTSNINADITLAKNSYIGLNSTLGSNSGFLGLSASGSFNNLNSSRIILFGNESTMGSAGQINVYSGNVSSGHLQFYTGNDSLILQVLNSGTTNFSPDGSTIRLSVDNLNTTITNPLIITNTTQSYSGTSGAVIVAGGIGIRGNATIEGTLSINNLTGNINFNNTMPSTSYSSGTIFISGGLGIENSTPAVSITSGGAISAAGGLALGKNAMIGGNVRIFSSDLSTDAETGSIVSYGGMGINGQTNIRSNNSPQIRITPVNNDNETSIQFGKTNNYTTSGSWKIGQNVENISTGTFSIYSADNGMYITLNGSNVIIDKSVDAILGITTSNLNFTGDLYKNGLLYTPESSQWKGQSTSGTIYYGTSGAVFVGIGTTNPQSTLDINGNMMSFGLTTGNLNFTGDLYKNGLLYTPESSQWSGTAASIHFATTGNVYVGIGTTNPISTLDIDGDVSIRSTIDNALNIDGGIVVNRMINLSGISTQFAGTFTVGNNIIVPTIAKGLLFPTANIRSFVSILNISTTRSTDGNIFTQYTLEGIQTESGWKISDNYIGDDINLSFSIDSTGQVNYISNNISNWLDTTIRFQATAYSITGNFTGITVETSGNFGVTGRLSVLNTEDAISLNLGAVIIDGGVSVAKNILIGGGATFGGHLIPNSNLVYDIGSTTNKWRDLYLSGNTIYLGDIPISTNTGGSISFGDTVISTNNSSGSTSIANLVSNNINASLINNSIATIGTLISNTISSNTISSNTISTSNLSSINATISNLTLIGSTNTIGNIFTTGGNVGINNTAPSYKLDVVGDIYASGDVISFSDIRLKSDIVTITEPIGIIDNLRGVYYTNNSNGKRSIGVIAQEVQNVLPEVIADQGTYLGVCYGNIVGLLIEGMKSLKNELNSIKMELKLQQSNITTNNITTNNITTNNTDNITDNINITTSNTDNITDNITTSITDNINITTSNIDNNITDNITDNNINITTSNTDNTDNNITDNITTSNTDNTDNINITTSNITPEITKKTIKKTINKKAINKKIINKKKS
jgi:hypothetical protein